MSSVDPTSPIPYAGWIRDIERSEQSGAQCDWSATRAARNEALRELLAPIKESVRDALAGFYNHLQHIDRACASFVQAVQAGIQLQDRYSSLFNELRLPRDFTTPAAQALLREYVGFACGKKNAKTNVLEIIDGIGVLKADVEHRIQNERMTRALAVASAKQHLLTLLGDAAALRAIGNLIDTDSEQARVLLGTLQQDVMVLAAAVERSHTGEFLVDQMRSCLTCLEESFGALVLATTSFRSPDAAKPCDQLILRNLRNLVEDLYPQLPPPAFQSPDSKRPDALELASDQRQAYLVVTRHLDVLKSALSAEKEFARVAAQERDQLLEDMIHRLDVSETASLIRAQAQPMSDYYPELGTSLHSLIMEVNDRFNEDLVRIQIEAQVDEEVARHLARQRLSSQDLREVLQLFIGNADLHQSFAQVLRSCASMPNRASEELRQYLAGFAELLSLARKLSPLVLQPLLHSPDTELSTVVGVERRKKDLELLKDNPEKLRAHELSSLVSLTAELLEANFPVANHSSEQYRVAAQIVVFGFAPQLKNRELERPVRDCASAATLVSRSAGASSSFAIVNHTIQSHLIPHLLVCKNESESNPVKRRYQLQRLPHETLLPVAEYLEYLAKRPLIVRKAAIQKPSPVGQVSKAIVGKRQDKNETVQTDQRAIEQRLKQEKIIALKRFLTRLESGLGDLSKDSRIAGSHMDMVERVQPVLRKLESLSARLTSSLSNGLALSEQSTYTDEFDKSCLVALREKIGFSPIGIPSKEQKRKAKEMNSVKIRGLIIDCLAKKEPGVNRLITDAKHLAVTLHEMSSELSKRRSVSPALSLTKVRSIIAVCQAAVSTENREISVILNQYCQLVRNIEPLVNVLGALTEVCAGLQSELSELEKAESALPGANQEIQQGEQHHGGQHETT